MARTLTITVMTITKTTRTSVVITTMAMTIEITMTTIIPTEPIINKEKTQQLNHNDNNRTITNNNQ